MTYFRQIASAAGDRFSYLLADMDQRQAVIIDPTDDQAVLYLALLTEIRVRLVRILLTHANNGPLHGVAKLAAICRAPVSASILDTPPLADHPLDEGALVDFGDEVIHTRLTPGLTPDAACYIWRDRVFTGDTLLIDTCATADGAASDAGMLFDSLTRQLLTLPDETLVYPARIGEGRQVSCIGEQRQRNHCLAGVTRDEFIAAQRRRSLRPGRDQETTLRRSAS